MLTLIVDYLGSRDLYIDAQKIAPLKPLRIKGNSPKVLALKDIKNSTKKKLSKEREKAPE